MTNDQVHPCLKALDADCFRARPAWAKQAFAYRLLHLLTPKPLTKRLPKALRLALIAAGVTVPPGLILPDGMVIAPGFEFPPGFAPGDPLPPGAMAPATTPPGVAATGPTPPTYIDIWSPGPPRTPSQVSVVAALYTITSDSTDGRVANVGYGWDTVRLATTGTLAHWIGAYSNVATQAYKRSATGFTIVRSFLTFDLSTLPSKTPKSVELKLYEYQYHASGVSVQQHTHDGIAYTYDYDSFLPTLFGHAAWADGDNTITFNAAGLTYIAGVLGSSAKLCLREYNHDYLNVPVTGYDNFRNGFYYSEEATTEYKPRLLIQF